MNKTVVIHQPDFLPYLGFFHRFLNAELWVILDNVQFVRGTSKSWTNRDKIKTPNGEKWITIAVQKTERESNINEIALSKNVDWRRDNLYLIRQNYGKSLYFDEIFPYIEELYCFHCEKLVDFNIKSIEMLLTMFDIQIERKMASAFNPIGRSNELLVDILIKVAATTYLSGVGARDYYDPKPFEDAGIKVIWQEFQHPVYTQLYGEFIPYLSAVDMLFNCGIEKSRKTIRSC